MLADRYTDMLIPTLHAPSGSDVEDSAAVNCTHFAWCGVVVEPDASNTHAQSFDCNIYSPQIFTKHFLLSIITCLVQQAATNHTKCHDHCHL